MSRTLYMIDGHAQIYRSYFAVLGLRSPTGEPTNATFGFVGMLLKLLQVRKPTHIVLTMDAGTSGRETLDANYKVQRKPMPEDMPQQIDRITQIVDTMGIPIFKAEGFEADDAMATLVRKIQTDLALPAGRLQYLHVYEGQGSRSIDRRRLRQEKGPRGGAYVRHSNRMKKLIPRRFVAKKGYSPTQGRGMCWP